MKRTALRPVSKRKAKALRAWWKIRREVEARADGRCEACRIHVLDTCPGRGCHAHHLLLRSQGGADDPSDLMWVSAEHHQWIHDHPAESYALGLLWRKTA